MTRREPPPHPGRHRKGVMDSDRKGRERCGDSLSGRFSVGPGDRASGETRGAGDLGLDSK
jgi:hypothetical protein